MKKCLPLIAILFFVASCQKFIDKQKEKIAMGIITEGQWYVEQFKVDDTVNITSDFLNYKFQFNDDGTVTGSNGTYSSSGTWKPDVPKQSIISDFPTANNPIKWLNGTWKLTDSYTDYVEAYMVTPTGKNKLYLRKAE